MEYDISTILKHYDDMRHNTRQYTARNTRAHNRKLTDEQILEIRQYKTSTKAIRNKLAIKYKVSETVIHYIITNLSHTNLKESV
jgi:hypothetical protein